MHIIRAHRCKWLSRGGNVSLHFQTNALLELVKSSRLTDVDVQASVTYQGAGERKVKVKASKPVGEVRQQ